MIIPFQFAPVMNYTGTLPTLDLSSGGISQMAEPERIMAAGGYLERRPGMYTSEIFQGRRYIHMGIDIWAPAGEPVFAFSDGRIRGFRDNNNPLDYGPTVITEHDFGGKKLYALYGHLSRETLTNLAEGAPVRKGDQIGTLGSIRENGGWIPHLHFQLSLAEPSEPDMPGVVSDDQLPHALTIYPDPRMVLGPIYL